MVKQGSKWWAENGKTFQVINVIEVDNHTWVYYRDLKKVNEEYKEYSCYIESFLQRFTPLPE
jgi:hypothetical protein